MTRAPTAQVGAGLQLDSGQDAAGTALRWQQLPVFVRELIAGGVAGGLAKTSVAPLERAKILFQTRRLGDNVGVSATWQHLWRTEGWAGLFRGNSASVLRITPYAAIHFGAYEHYKRLLQPPPPSTGATDADVVVGTARPAATDRGFRDLAAGSAAGVTACSLTYPLDLIRTRMAWSTSAAPGAAAHAAQPGIMNVIATTARAEGVRGLYRGLLPTLIGIAPYAGLKFELYATFKAAYRHSYQQPAAMSNDGHEPRLPVPVMLLFGGVSGLVAQTATYPLDVVRRRMQVEGCEALQRGERVQPHGMVATARLIYATEGLRGFARGLFINYLKVIPSTAVGFTVYDYMKRSLHLKGV